MRFSESDSSINKFGEFWEKLDYGDGDPETCWKWTGKKKCRMKK
jgi:hypothetical protein